MKNKTNCCCCRPSTSVTLKRAKLLAEKTAADKNNNSTTSIHQLLTPQSYQIQPTSRIVSRQSPTIIKTDTNKTLGAKAQAFFLKFMPLIEKSHNKEKKLLKISLKRQQKAKKRLKLPLILIASDTDDSTVELSQTIDDHFAQKTIEKIVENYNSKSNISLKNTELLSKCQINDENYNNTTINIDKSKHISVKSQSTSSLLEIPKKIYNNNKSINYSNFLKSNKNESSQKTMSYYSPLLTQSSKLNCYDNTLSTSMNLLLEKNFDSTSNSNGIDVTSEQSNINTNISPIRRIKMIIKLSSLGLIGEETAFKKLLSNSLLQVFLTLFIY